MAYKKTGLFYLELVFNQNSSLGFHLGKGSVFLHSLIIDLYFLLFSKVKNLAAPERKVNIPWGGKRGMCH